MPNRPTRPYLEIRNWKGLVTKAATTAVEVDQLRTSQNTDVFRKITGLAKCKGSSRVLNTQYTESGTAQPMSWIGFYKHLAKNGETLRRVLVAAGTTIRLIDTAAGTTSQLASGRTSNLAHVADKMGEYMIIQNQNPNLIGAGDDPVKYDGYEITKWGVEAPGGDETVRDSFDDVSTWSVPAGLSSTITDETTTTRDGAAIRAVQANGVAYSAMHKKIGSFAADTVQSDRLTLDVYIEPTSYDNLRTSSDALRIFFSSDAALPITTNYYRFDFDVGDLSPGWNTLFFDFTSAPTGSNGTSDGTLDTGNVQLIEVEAFGLTNSSAVNVVWDRLVSLSRGIATGAFSNETGSVFSNNSTSGIYRYVVTFGTKHGLESNLGAALSMDNRSDGNTWGQVDLSNIPTSDDGQVTLRRIYRTVGGGSTYLLLATIRDNTTTTYTDTTADASLGTRTPPQSASIVSDNSRPPKGGIVKVWQRTCFVAGDPENPSLLYFSRDSRPEAFPLINQIDLEAKITAIWETALGLMVATEKAWWRFDGFNPNFSIQKVIVGVGCAGPRAAGTARHLGWAADRDGMRFYNLQQSFKVSAPIRDKFDALTRSTIGDMHTHHLTKDNVVFLFNKDSSGNFTEIYVYQYHFDNITQGFWSTLSLPSTVDVLDADEVEDANGDSKLYIGDNAGMVYELWDDDAKTWATPTSSENITTTLVGPYIRPGERLRGAEFQGKCLPTMMEIQATGDATTWQATLELSEGPDSGTAKDSTTVNFQFGSNNTLIRQRIRGLHRKEYFRLTLTNTTAAESTLLAVRVWFEMYPGQHSVTTVDNS